MWDGFQPVFLSETQKLLPLQRVRTSMRIRLAIYGAASLFLLAFYAPAKAMGAFFDGLRQRSSN